MLYDEPAEMLRRAGALLTSGEVAAMTADQRRAVGVQLARLGAMWPDLFVTLDRENDVLTRARDEVASRLSALGDAGALESDDPVDPIERYRHVLRQLNDALPRLHAQRHTDDGAAALATLRQALHSAGEIEARMVDKAWAVR
jgi:hypothetical protein